MLGALKLVIGVEPESFQARSFFKRRCFFFSFQIFLSKFSPFSDRKEGGELYWAGAFLDGLSQGSQVDKVWGLVFSKEFFRGSQVEEAWDSLNKEGGWKLSIVSLTNVSQLSNSLPRCSIWALTKGWYISWKKSNKVKLFGALSASNSMDWRCLR